MSIKDLVYIALMAALTVALAVFPPLTVPAIGVPITAQSAGVMLAGGILGAKRGALALALVLVLVAIGLPVLSGGRGGMGIFAGPTAGFLFGWVFGAFVTGWLIERWWAVLNPLNAFVAVMIGGVGAVYLLGVPWISVSADVDLWKALSGSVAFIPGDVVKAVVATVVIVGVKKAYPLLPVARG